MKIVSAALLLLGIAATANGAAPSRLPMPSPPRVILNLPYVGASIGPLTNTPPAHPNSVQLFDDENTNITAIPHFISTDWKGNIYILDSLNDYAQLRCFTKTGRFMQAWRPLLSYGDEGSLCGAVTNGGYIWLSGVGVGCRDLPIVIYRHGVHAPVMDFRNAMPRAMEQTINRVLVANRQGPMDNLGIMDNTVEAGENEVAVSFHLFKSGVLSLRFSADGKRLLSARFIHAIDNEVNNYSEPMVPYLAPDDTVWSVGSHVVANAESKDPDAMWTTLRVQEFGARQPALVIDRARKTLPASGRLWIKEALPPEVMLDAKHNVYVLWSHEDEQYPEDFVTFRVNGAKVDFHVDPNNEARALSVFNAHGKLIFTMPWTYTTLESGPNWVQPLPDGSGFYRMMFGKSAAHIDFFKLPSR